MHIYVIHDRHASGRARDVHHARIKKLLNGRVFVRKKKNKGQVEILRFSPSKRESIFIIFEFLNLFNFFDI